MKIKYRTLGLFLSALLVLFGYTDLAIARSVEGVDFPESIDLSGSAVRLNGTAIREKFFVDIYIAGLYLEHPSTDALAILQDTGAKRMRFHFLYRELAREKLLTAWREAFEKNLSPVEQASAEGGLKQLKPMLDDEYRVGDELVLDLLPSGAVRVITRGVVKGEINMPGFAKAVLAAWIGSSPPSEKFKKGLLGGVER